MERYALGSTVPLTGVFLDQGGTLLTGLTIGVQIWRKTDGQFWDGASAYQVADPALSATEVDDTNNPGVYQYDFDTSAGATETEHGFLLTEGTGTARNAPQDGAFGIGLVDSIEALPAYQGMLWFSSVTGSAGAVVGVNGIPTNPCNAEADIRTLATATGLRRIHVVGSITLGATYGGYSFHGGSHLKAQSIVNLNSFGHSLIAHNCFVSGVATGGRIAAYNCEVGSFTGRLDAYDCVLSGTHNLEANKVSRYMNCASAGGEHRDGHGFWSPSFFASTTGTTANITGFKGEIFISEMNHADDFLDAVVDGKITFQDAGNTAGTVRLKGQGYINDEKTGGYGGTIDTTGFIVVPDVLAMEEALVGRIEIDTSATPWRENHYDLATRTSIVRAFELFDRTGAAISGNESGGNNPLAMPTVVVARRVLV